MAIVAFCLLLERVCEFARSLTAETATRPRPVGPCENTKVASKARSGQRRLIHPRVSYTARMSFGTCGQNPRCRGPRWLIRPDPFPAGAAICA
jgi:hypothetical protein